MVQLDEHPASFHEADAHCKSFSSPGNPYAARLRHCVSFEKCVSFGLGWRYRRFSTSVLDRSDSSRIHFPWPTLAINVLGSFILGLFLTWALGRLPIALTTPVSVGVLGGFTTFSAFAWEGLFLTKPGE